MPGAMVKAVAVHSRPYPKPLHQPVLPLQEEKGLEDLVVLAPQWRRKLAKVMDVLCAKQVAPAKRNSNQPARPHQPNPAPTQPKPIARNSQVIVVQRTHGDQLFTLYRCSWRKVQKAIDEA